ncbi:DUF1801 domain-containing protein [Kocuria sp. SM24M-10]|uniref:DUF1801 domain-containing protein n=1 Tax=Kocuria sp. SM24M-10 TaxID=1660349 RepID=UPI00064AF3BA|nr:DUF1801 domain-containing protein [Kocuria sp. SM24M-10]KLU09408.1 hypothetical protein ABL57_12310 [Kocuria sp. SM24M-10]
MEKTPQPVEEFLEGVTPRKRRNDAERLLPLFARATGETPTMWGTIIGFCEYHYRYASGHEGDAPAASFAPRRAATTIYLFDGVSAYPGELARLGPHTTGVGCLYVKDLDGIDLGVLEDVVAASYRAVTWGTFGRGAHDGAASG